MLPPITQYFTSYRCPFSFKVYDSPFSNSHYLKIFQFEIAYVRSLICRKNPADIKIKFFNYKFKYSPGFFMIKFFNLVTRFADIAYRDTAILFTKNYTIRNHRKNLFCLFILYIYIAIKVTISNRQYSPLNAEKGNPNNQIISNFLASIRVSQFFEKNPPEISGGASVQKIDISSKKEAQHRIAFLHWINWRFEYFMLRFIDVYGNMPIFINIVGSYQTKYFIFFLFFKTWVFSQGCHGIWNLILVPMGGIFLLGALIINFNLIRQDYLNFYDCFANNKKNLNLKNYGKTYEKLYVIEEKKIDYGFYDFNYYGPKKYARGMILKVLDPNVLRKNSTLDYNNNKLGCGVNKLDIATIPVLLMAKTDQYNQYLLFLQRSMYVQIRNTAFIAVFLNDYSLIRQIILEYVFVSGIANATILRKIVQIFSDYLVSIAYFNVLYFFTFVIKTHNNTPKNLHALAKTMGFTINNSELGGTRNLFLIIVGILKLGLKKFTFWIYKNLLFLFQFPLEYQIFIKHNTKIKKRDSI